MSTSRILLCLAIAPALFLLGCASSRWDPKPQDPPAAAATLAPANTATQAGTVNPQGMQEVLAEIQRTGNLDPAAQEQLIHDLQQVDPSLWPQMVLQFRAQLAYAQRARQQMVAAAQPGAAVPGPASAVQQVSYVTTIGDRNVPPANGPAGVVRPEAIGTAAPVKETAFQQQAKIAPATLPPAAAVGAMAAPKAAGGGDTPSNSIAAAGDSASQDSSSAQQNLTAVIRAKEAELSAGGKTDGDEAQQAQLRMLYLLAGRRDDALRPIPSATAATQAFWTEQFYGLSTLLDEKRSGDTSRRAAEAKQHLDDALQRLGEHCPLLIHNLSFCKRIQSYGCVEPFDSSEFSPSQPVLLYAEVENLTAKSTARGYHTSLRSSYQIFDGRGQQLAEDQFTQTEEYCRNVRHDYFVGYELRLPERIYPGKYTLKLTVEDLTSHNVAQSSLDFTIKSR
jgi:hypothetical protein